METQPGNYPIIFTHIPRSAGTTLVKIISNQYATDRQFFFYVKEKGGTTETALREFGNLPEERRKKIQLLLGHTSYGIHRYYETYTYIALLRDPVDRAVSYYYYVLKLKEHYLHNAVVGNRMRLEEFVASGMSAELDNIQTRQLSGIQVSPGSKCDEKWLETAKQNIVRHYAVCGITEQFDESLILMKRLFGWRHPFYIELNRIDHKPPRQQLPASTIRIIEQTNPLDVELYRFARQRFQSILAQQDDSYWKELKQFTKYNAMLRRLSKPSTGSLGIKLWNTYLKLRLK